jgi:hypothetical protein
MARDIYADDATLDDHYRHWLSITCLDSLAQEQVRRSLKLPEQMRFVTIAGKVMIETPRGRFDLTAFPVKVERRPLPAPSSLCAAQDLAEKAMAVLTAPKVEPAPASTGEDKSPKQSTGKREGLVWAKFIIPHMLAKIAERKAAGMTPPEFRTLGAAAREAAKSMETEEAKKWLKAQGKKPLTEDALENGIRDRHRGWLVPGWTGKKGSV